MAWTFKHIPCEIGALEAEEIGVEHLLRDIKDTTVSTLAQDVGAKVTSLRGLKSHLEMMQTYLTKVAAGELPINNTIIYQLQDIFNLLPNLSTSEVTITIFCDRVFAVSSPLLQCHVIVSSCGPSSTACCGKRDSMGRHMLTVALIVRACPCLTCSYPSRSRSRRMTC
eukprot:SAG31_NODE_7_length_42755_cov_130.245728_8_plen_168_part_00